jgi:hypothetical protein
VRARSRRGAPSARLVKDRVAVHWGTLQPGAGHLNSLEQIVAEVPEFDKVLFLSRPGLSAAVEPALKAALARHSRHELLDTVAIGAHRASGRPITATSISITPTARACCAWPVRVANRAMRATRHHRRRLPDGMRPYGGSSWWALSRACVQDCWRASRREPGILRFFRSVACPDEMFFQTLVMNSRVQGPRAGAELPLRPVAGARRAQSQGPRRGHDFERIAASRAHFCRKIDSRASATLLPRLLALRAA